jgi:SPFH domain / Band 7 family
MFRPAAVAAASTAALVVLGPIGGLLTAFTATDGGTISVIRNGGLLDDRAVRQVDGAPQIVPPGSSLTYTGMWSSEHPYPAGQRNFVIAARPAAAAPDADSSQVDSREVINVPSKDGVMIGVEGTFYFELTRDPTVLAQFDDKFGTRTYPGADGARYAAWDGDAGWSAFLNFTLGNLIQNDLRRELVQVSCTDLIASCSLASNGAAPVVIDPDAAPTDKIQNVQDAVNTQFAKDVEATLGGPYFTNIKFVMSKAVLPDNVQDAINDAQGAFAAVTKAQAGKQAAQIEAETNAVKQQGYNACQTCADIERLKALPPGLTTYAPGQGFAVGSR